MTYLESILETLKTLSPETESHAFVAFSLKTELGWRLAIDENNDIHFFLPRADLLASHLSPVRLKYLSISPVSQLDVYDTETKTTTLGSFYKISIQNTDDSHQLMFLNLMENLIIYEPAETIAQRISDLVRLFAVDKRVDKKKVLGLWGELLFILQSDDVSSRIREWQETNNSRHDFVSSEGLRHEVKTSLNAKRIHTVSQSQLTSYTSKFTRIVSILTEEVHDGVSIQVLLKDIQSQLHPQDHYLREQLIRKVTSLIGVSPFAWSHLKFDRNLGVSSMTEFPAEAIPLLQCNLPESYVGAKFEINFENFLQ